MGEYIWVCGEPDARKLGTCEDLFYARFDDLWHWAQPGRALAVPGNLEPADYLREAGGWRYRFPFADEDLPGGGAWGRGDTARYYGAHDRVLVVSAPAAVFEEIEHDAPVQRVAYSVGDALEQGAGACPQAGAAALGGEVGIKAQRLIGGDLWTVVQCPGCGAMWRLTPARAASLSEHLRATSTDADTLEAARRMAAGYTLAERMAALGWVRSMAERAAGK